MQIEKFLIYSNGSSIFVTQIVVIQHGKKLKQNSVPQIVVRFSEVFLFSPKEKMTYICGGFGFAPIG